MSTLFEIIGGIILFINAITTILLFLKKFRNKVITNLVNALKIDSISADSTLGKFLEHRKTHEINIDNRLQELEKGVLRLEIGRLIDHEPENRKLILDLYDKYKSEPYNGNSYMDGLIDEWKFKYYKDV